MPVTPHHLLPPLERLASLASLLAKYVDEQLSNLTPAQRADLRWYPCEMLVIRDEVRDEQDAPTNVVPMRRQASAWPGLGSGR